MVSGCCDQISSTTLAETYAFRDASGLIPFAFSARRTESKGSLRMAEITRSMHIVYPQPGLRRYCASDIVSV